MFNVNSGFPPQNQMRVIPQITLVPVNQQGSPFGGNAFPSSANPIETLAIGLTSILQQMSASGISGVSGGSVTPADQVFGRSSQSSGGDLTSLLLMLLLKKKKRKTQPPVVQQPTYKPKPKPYTPSRPTGGSYGGNDNYTQTQTTYRQTPVTYRPEPEPVVYQPAPVVYQPEPAPIVYEPAPAPAPAPAPVIYY